MHYTRKATTTSTHPRRGQGRTPIAATHKHACHVGAHAPVCMAPPTSYEHEGAAQKNCVVQICIHFKARTKPCEPTLHARQTGPVSHTGGRCCCAGHQHSDPSRNIHKHAHDSPMLSDKQPSRTESEHSLHKTPVHTHHSCPSLTPSCLLVQARAAAAAGARTAPTAAP